MQREFNPVPLSQEAVLQDDSDSRCVATYRIAAADPLCYHGASVQRQEPGSRTAGIYSAAKGRHQPIVRRTADHAM
jgi:hypothetical protein